MRYILTVLFTLILGYNAASQGFHDGVAEPLLGPITINQVLELDGWFGEEFMTYAPERFYTKHLNDVLQGVTVVTIMGTWCEDCKKYVPQMLKILQQANIDPAQLKMIGVDRDKDSPGGEAAKYHVEKVPTFVLEYEGQEIGRIVEEPIGKLEKDIIGIVKKKYPNKIPRELENAVLDDRMAPKTAPDGTLMEPVEPKADEPAPEENSDTPPKDAADEPAK